MIRALACVVRRDLALAFRRKTDVANTLVFFVIVTSLFPLGVGPERLLLHAIAPGILWVAALLAAMLSLGRMFEPDYADGTLEQMALGVEPLAVLVIGKIAAHWLLTGLPLTLLSPLLAVQFDLQADAIAVLCGGLLIGTAALSLVGAIGAGLTLGLRGGGVLAALLVLPLYVPVLIFGAGAVDATVTGLGPQAHLSLLGALTLGGVFFAPWATTAALRIALE